MSRSAFREELAKRVVKSRHHARKNDRWASGAYVIAVSASFGTTLLAAFSTAPKVVLALLPALSGAALLATRIFKFEDKARWHRTRKRLHESLLMRLNYEGESVAVLSQEYRAREAELDQEYPRFGAPADKG